MSSSQAGASAPSTNAAAPSSNFKIYNPLQEGYKKWNLHDNTYVVEGEEWQPVRAQVDTDETPAKLGLRPVLKDGKTSNSGRFDLVAKDLNKAEIPWVNEEGFNYVTVLQSRKKGSKGSWITRGWGDVVKGSQNPLRRG